ncbi:MAG: Holliday junction resolvase RuvX [Saprospiraceae bacterium]|nr:Holliday junction resolvase RuvX [Saprospiraceae bacterium]
MKGRILGIDYGRKRIGMAATDPLQIIVSPLETVENDNFKAFLEDYITQEHVVKIVFGRPTHADGNLTHLWTDIQRAVKYISEKHPRIAIDYQDENFTSSDAMTIAIQGGMKKKKRRDKKNIDKISAVLILQRYLGHI